MMIHQLTLIIDLI